jgi:hypothetical protein
MGPALERARTGGVLALLFVFAVGLGAAGTSEAAPVRSVQRGSTILAPRATRAEVELAAVDPARAFVIFGVAADGATEPVDVQVTGRLAGPTRVAFERVGSAGTLTLTYAVVEYARDVLVWRGSNRDNAATTTRVALPAPVDPARSFPLTSMRMGGRTFGCTDLVRARLADARTLELSRGCLEANAVIEWQVIQHEGVRVTTGEVTFGREDVAATATLDQGATGNAWLLYAIESEGRGPPSPGTLLVRGAATGPRQLTFDRAVAGQALTVTYHLVDFHDGTRVFQGTERFAAGEDQRTIAVGASSADRAFLVTGGAGRFGRAPAVAGPAAGWFAGELLADGRARLIRGPAPGVPAELGWAVIQPLGASGGGGSPGTAAPRLDGAAAPEPTATGLGDGGVPGAPQVVDLAVGCACATGAGRRPAAGALLPMGVLASALLARGRRRRTGGRRAG